jgi:hypothetical protein
MSADRSVGCATHLLIIGGLLGAVVVYGIVQNLDTVSLMVDNLAIMNEQAAQADALRAPADLVDYLAAHPDRASLVAYDAGARAEGLFYGADTPRPLTGVPRLLLLAEYARQVEAGRLDPTARVPLDAVAPYALPGSSRRPHRRARARLVDQGHVGPDSTTALRHLARSAFRLDDPAAADWLLRRLGRPALRRAPDRLGIPDIDPPLPTSGVHLLWHHHDQTASPAARVDTLAALAAPARARRAYRLMDRLRRDSAFRHTEHTRRARRGSGLSLRQQRALARHTAPRGTAADYATLLRRVATGSLLSPDVSARMQAALERPTDADSVGLSLRAVASTGGATPGLLSLAGYARREGDAPPRVVVLVLERLPMAVFYHLLQTSLDKGLFLRLLGDDAFFDRVRDTLESKAAERSDSLSAHAPPEPRGSAGPPLPP